METKEKEKPKRDKRMFTLFFVIIFSLLIAMTRYITDGYIAMFFQVVLIFSQMVIVKNLIDSYMGEE
jgi:hypothetical protein